jgi:hypothetical protein
VVLVDHVSPVPVPLLKYFIFFAVAAPSLDVGLVLLGLGSMGLMLLVVTPVMSLLSVLTLFLLLTNAISFPDLWAAL